MKFITISLILFSLNASATDVQILRSSLSGNPVQIYHDEKFLTLKAPGIDSRVPMEKCSQTNYKYFLIKLRRLSKTSSSSLEKNAFAVEVEGHRKVVHPQSKLGIYVNNITQHLLTLKNEMALACKKK